MHCQQPQSSLLGSCLNTFGTALSYETSYQLMRLFLTALAASVGVAAWDAAEAAATIDYGVYQVK
jgi:hypothetical protein